MADHADPVDHVRPDNESIQRTLEYGYKTWSSYAQKAELEDTLPSSCFQLRNILKKTPQLQFSWNHQGETTTLNLESNGELLYSSGRSIWRLSNGSCDA